MPRPVHFELSAKDPDSLAKFYEEALDWKVQKWGGETEYWLLMTGEEGEPGIDGGLMRRDERTPPGTVNYYDVPDIDEYVDRSVSAGGKLMVPRMPVPGVGWIAVIEDPEGNVYGLMQGDRDAK